MKARYFMAISSLALLTAGCGGGGGGGSASTGSFSLGVSDNPANVESVTIAFRQVALKNADNEDQTFSFEVADQGEFEQVDLLNFTGSQVETLVNNQQIPVGRYQLCIYMRNDANSFVRQNGAEQNLTTPSQGSACGVQVESEANIGLLFFNQPFTIAAGENNFVAEFNLERGLIKPPGLGGSWRIKPTAVQLVNNAEVGTISGEVAPNVINECAVAAGNAGETDTPVNKVYLYEVTAEVEDNDATIPNMVDFRTDDLVGPNEVAPIAAAEVREVTEGATTTLQYELAFVTPGTYSVGFTCLAQNDDPEATDLATDPEPFFLTEDAQGVVVESNTTTVQDLSGS